MNSHFSLDVLDGRPVLRTYVERIRTELSPHYEDVHKAVAKMKKRFPGGSIPGIYEPLKKANL